eukprot:Hpha_TRINITY_DN13764_c0_g1::TRINITY_DN13764_c0_g1_i1::g.142737::m.142737/K00804/GGPS1; geranylgeranyl diphosphate synthase, type III
MTDAEILAPYDHLAQIPGKGFRGLLINAFNVWMKCPPHIVKGVTQVVQKLHNASLLVDDIEDGSLQRRGLPAAHTIYGVALTINASGYVMVASIEEAAKLTSDSATQRDIMAIITEELRLLHRGQGQELFYRETGQVPSLPQFVELAQNKTGGLFRLSVRLLQALAAPDAPLKRHNFIPLLNKMGLYFQVLDDYLNLKSTEYYDSKTFCEDISEGKWSFPILHSVRSCKEKGESKLKTIVRQRTTDIALKKYCLTLMEETDSFAYTRNYLAELFTEIVREVKALPGGNPGVLFLFEKLHRQLGGEKFGNPKPKL